MNTIFQKQLAQRIGRLTETVEVEVKEGSNRFDFPQTSNNLNKATVIGLEIGAGKNGMKSPKKMKELLTLAEISTGRLHLEGTNKEIIDLPLRLFVTDSKPMIYIPIEPFANFNPSQSYIYFAQNFPANTDKVLEINIICD
jgi:hypothetical protein